MTKNDKSLTLPERRLIKLREFASTISVSVRQLYRMIDQGDVPRPVKQGNQSYFLTEDLDRYIQNLEKQRS